MDTKESKLKVRNLQERDLWRLLAIVSKGKDTILPAINDAKTVVTNDDGTTQTIGAIAMVQAEDGTRHFIVNREALGLALIPALLDAMVDQEARIKSFLADVAGIKPEKFDALPMGSSFEIIAQIIEQDGIDDFLARLSALVNAGSGKLSI